MMAAIDGLAKVVGYCAMLAVVLLILNEFVSSRAAAKRWAAHQVRLDKLRLEDPQRYDREVRWRSNLERHRAGMPTDSRFEEELEQTIQRMNKVPNTGTMHDK